MLTRLFAQINSSTSFFVGLFAVCLAVASFFISPNNIFFLKTAYNTINFGIWIGLALTIVISLVVIFGFQGLFQNHKLLKRNAYLGVFLPVLIPIFFTLGNINFLINLVFLLFIYWSWLAIFQGEKLLARTLNTGLLIGAASIFDVRMGFLLLISMVVYIIFGRLNVRTFLILLIGFLSIWLNALMLEFIFLDSSSVYDVFLTQFNGKNIHDINSISVVYIVIVAACLLPAILEFAKTFSREGVFKRQAFTVLMVMLFLGILLAFVLGVEVISLVLIVPALAVLFVNFFQNISRIWVKELIIWCSIASMLFINSAWL